MTEATNNPHRQRGFSSSLTDEEMARITELADPESGDRLTAYRISKIIGRPQTKVSWFMYRNGLQPRSRFPTRKPHERRGIMVRPYSPEEDAFIEKLRTEGATLSAIGRAVQDHFGWPRRSHSIHVRLVMLAGFDEEQTIKVAAE